MAARRKSKEATAHHEAGHVVAHLVRGLPIIRVSIRRQGDMHGHCAHPPPLLVGEAGQRRSVARAMIVACYAGIEAERIYDPSADEVHGSSDFADAFNLSRNYEVLPRTCSFVGDDAHQAYLKKLRSEARALMRANWAAVSRVAAALLREGDLDAERIAQVIAEP